MIAFLKAIAKQNNVKLGKRKAGWLSATFPHQGVYDWKVSLTRAARKASLLMSFHTKHTKLL